MKNLEEIEGLVGRKGGVNKYRNIIWKEKVLPDMVEERVVYHIAFGLWLNMGHKVWDGVWSKVGHYLDVDIRRRWE